ncbi:hypothetical protein [Acidovorax sp.]|jgi:tetratricopeptide (TPR) repeat protein|uniref:hypothetical protein n=1 Tax=Acidovorax sp. TaxID=1872122 RepID=UPI0027B9A076|nr:hypothetical protein [Acidovorax sp.]
MNRNRPFKRLAPVKEAPPREQALRDYSATVENVERLPTIEVAWELAEARDRLAALGKGKEQCRLDELEEVAALDKRARVALARVPGAAAKSFESLRDARDADAKRWWWAPATWAGNANDSLWLVLTATCWALALTLTTTTINRWLVGGPDWTTVIAVAVQAVLALLGGAAFLDWGRSWLLSVAAVTRQPVGSRHLVAFGMTVAALSVAVGIRGALPHVALLYQMQGQTHFEAGRLASALESWRRASSLDPDPWELRYQLGSVLERMAEVDKAIAEYRLAVASPDAPVYVHSNLARLYLAQKSDPTSALALLDAALRAHEKQDQVRYRLLINRGAAYLALQLPRLAQYDAASAKLIAKDLGWSSSPSADCLLAQASKSKDLVQWTRCITPTMLDEVSDPRWQAFGREKLMEEPK